MGHLFQNRYKSSVVEAEPSLLELVRSLHLNPFRAQVVPDLRTLDRFPWTGHSALLGTVPRPWQETQILLAQFGPTPARARRAYRACIADGVAQGRRPEFHGGGLVRGLGGWAAVTARQLLAYIWVEVLGRRASSLAQEIGQTRGNVSRSAQRGATPAARWQAQIPTWRR